MMIKFLNFYCLFYSQTKLSNCILASFEARKLKRNRYVVLKQNVYSSYFLQNIERFSFFYTVKADLKELKQEIKLAKFIFLGLFPAIHDRSKSIQMK